MIIRVKDADEKLFELDALPEKEEKGKEEKEEKGDALSAAEIKVLKKLAAKAKDLLALVSDEEEEEPAKEGGKKPAKPGDYFEGFDVETEVKEDGEGEEGEDKGEEIVEDSCYRCGDSAKSINSIEKKKVADSATVVDHDEEVNNAWANFYANQL